MVKTELKHNLINQHNYLKKINIINKKQYIVNYTNLIHEYLLYSNENIIIQNNTYYLYVIIKGLECILNIYNFLLLYTKNYDVVYYHCQKAYYYYVEFISQIGNENNSYLKLNTKDALLFVYKKTIFQLKKEYVHDCDTDEKEYLLELSNIFNEFNKLIEKQLTLYKNKYLNIDNIIENNNKVLKHILNKNNICKIIKVNNHIIHDLKNYYDIEFIIKVIYYFNKKINSYNDKEIENTILSEYRFNYNNSYKNYSALKLTNIFFS